jgi:2,6-dihydroxypseudooxynicotine hydrolase
VSLADALVRAAVTYHFAKFIVFEDQQQYQFAHHKTVSLYRRAAPLLDPPAQRVEMPYAGTLLPGYLRRPRGAARPPVVLLVAGLDSVKEEIAALEPLFLQRGVATLTFDGPGQGEVERALPIEPAFERPVAAVVDWLQARTDVDGARVAMAGTSFGGYYAARAAAFEPRLVCAVNMGGPYEFAPTFDSIPPMSQHAFMERSHSPDLEAARRRAAEVTLVNAAPRIRMPFLIVFGKQDRLIPYQQAERLYAELPSADKRLELYEDGNHVCNNLPFAYRPLVADWVAQHLGA